MLTDLLGELNGWAAGQTGNAVAGASLDLFIGEQQGDDFWISASSLDENGNPIIRFADADLSCGAVSTP